jgi:phenylalanyl-tRNA synthetase beta subunit
MLAGLVDRRSPGAHWHTKAEPCDFYDLKGAVESLLEGLQISGCAFARNCPGSVLPIPGREQRPDRISAVICPLG